MEPVIINLYNKIKDKTEINRELSSDLHFAVDENFKTEGSRLGKTWVPLSPLYSRKKNKDPRASKLILHRYGSLQRSIIEKYSDEFAAVSTNDIRAGALFFGTTIQHYPRQETFTRTTKNNKFSKLPKEFSKRNIGQGTKYRAYSVTIPARNAFQVNNSDYDKFANTIAEHIAGV